MTQQDNILTADEGKVIRRTEDQHIYGKEIALGYSYYIGGIKLGEPHLDVAEDFEEIDEPTEETSESESTESETTGLTQSQLEELLEVING